MDRNLVICSALLCVALCFSMCTYIPVAEAIVPLVILGVGLLIGAICGGVAGWYITTQYQEVALKESVGADYVTDVATEYQNLIDSQTQEYINEAPLMQRAVYYFDRRAEAAAQYYVNETIMPYAKVYATSGLQTEYQNLVTGLQEQLGSLMAVAEGYAESTFQGDLSTFTVKAYGVDLKSYDYNLCYGLIWDFANPAYNSLSWNNGSWTYLASPARMRTSYVNQVMTSENFTLSGNSTLEMVGHLTKQSTPSITTPQITLELHRCNDSALIDSAPNVSGSIYADSGYWDSWTVEGQAQDTECYLVIKNTSGGDGSIWFDVRIYFSVDTVPQIDDGFQPVVTVPYQYNQYAPVVSIIPTAVDFVNSTATLKSVNTAALYLAMHDYCEAMKNQMQTAMNSATAYHAYLRSLGYTDYTQIDTLIPMPDLITPPTNSTFFDDATIPPEEKYAMLAAYMQSLYDLFSNATIGRQIQSVNFTQIEFLKLPIYCSGYVYENESGVVTGSGYCSSIWLQPLNGNLTLLRGQNNTMGQSVQAVFKANDTLGTITYKLLDEDDFVDVEQIYLRDANGNITTAISYTITTGSLDAYATVYVTGYEGLNLEVDAGSLDWMLGLMPALLMVMVVMSFMNSRGRH
jgi:hypothetical protein